MNRNACAQDFGVELLDGGLDLDLAEFVDGAFVDGEGEIKRRTIRRELCDGRYDVEVGVTVTDIEAAKLLAAIGFKPVDEVGLFPDKYFTIYGRR